MIERIDTIASLDEMIQELQQARRSVQRLLSPA